MFLLNILIKARGIEIIIEINAEIVIENKLKSREISGIFANRNIEFNVIPIAKEIIKKNQILKKISVLNLISKSISKTANIIANNIEIKLDVGSTSVGGLIP